MITVFDSNDSILDGMKYVKDNDAYFDAKSKLLDSDLVHLILKEIDGAEYVSEDVFLGRNKKIGGLNKMYLSTGAKTLLNIVNEKNICFDVIECGNNVLDLLPMLSCKADGYIFWKDCLYPFEDDFDCDISYHGKRFQKVFAFEEEVAKEA